MSITNFKAGALSTEVLRQSAPSVFAQAAAPGLSARYTFVPNSEIVAGLQEANWAPVEVEEQRPRKVERRGFQKHLIRFRQAGQMQTLDECGESMGSDLELLHVDFGRALDAVGRRGLEVGKRSRPSLLWSLCSLGLNSRHRGRMAGG